MAVKAIKVSQLNQYIKRVMQTDPILANLSVAGEISNLKYHDSGHVYFTLKDEGGKLSCFLPESALGRIRYELADGVEITAYGRINVYEKGGTYSLYVSDIEVSGVGELTAAFQRLKEKLEQEGLFDAKHKKAIPVFAKKVIVITAETGAAIRDILRTIRNKNDLVQVIVYPCLVQGNGAAADISRAIEQVNLLFSDADCLIVGRGGGSIEELWAFNEETVARSIFASKIPVISAVGHETDFTIADFVADVRSATPTAAAELAVFDSRKLRRDLIEWKDELQYTMRGRIRRWELEISVNQMGIMKTALIGRLERYKIEINHFASSLSQAFARKAEHDGNVLDKQREALQYLNPSRLLERGYAAVTDKNGAFLHSVRAVGQGDAILVTMADGNLDCLVREIRHQQND